MIVNVVLFVHQRTQALTRIFRQETRHNVRESHGELGWSVVFAFYNGTEQIHLRHAVTVERRATSNHFVY